MECIEGSVPGNVVKVGKVGKVKRGERREVDQFLREFRTPLVKLSRMVQKGEQTEDLETFVDSVLTAWSDRFPMPPQQAVSDLERTFWYVLYTLEDLPEVPQKDPFRALLLRNLSLATTSLSRGGRLPRGFFATRPDELLHEGLDEELLY